MYSMADTIVCGNLARMVLLLAKLEEKSQLDREFLRAFRHPRLMDSARKTREEQIFGLLEQCS
jgi:hypothetical protein